MKEKCIKIDEEAEKKIAQQHIILENKTLILLDLINR